MTIERVKYYPIEGGPVYTYWSRDKLLETFAEGEMPFGYAVDEDSWKDREFLEQLNRYEIVLMYNRDDDEAEVVLFDGKPIGTIDAPLRGDIEDYETLEHRDYREAVEEAQREAAWEIRLEQRRAYE